MNVSSKRYYFWGLVTLYLVHSAVIYLFAGASAPVLSGRAVKGKLLFQEHNCIACHQIYGLGGYMGPDLTNVMSAPGKGEVFARAFIQSGTLRMPRFELSDSEVEALVAYLKEVDRTGTSPVVDFRLQMNGTVSQTGTK